ncbi:uncharacterized protein N7483_012473 [Penicillium malachiteum]|uniref:uncharacterized protein n=1 Tax=Penicillium malachiteum TaxID=1324776 RepID=UPI0025484F31|nr:uncharacterized protein N7483_012473 [Penicillium malachiteum]KAJ5715292.1 hypothetical protein N7483_012473 [Penicillium malachiteum]
MDSSKNTGDDAKKRELRQESQELQRQNAGQARKVSKMAREREVAAMRGNEREESLLQRKNEQIDELQKENAELKDENRDLKREIAELKWQIESGLNLS